MFIMGTFLYAYLLPIGLIKRALKIFSVLQWIFMRSLEFKFKTIYGKVNAKTFSFANPLLKFI